METSLSLIQFCLFYSHPQLDNSTHTDRLFSKSQSNWFLFFSYLTNWRILCYPVTGPTLFNFFNFFNYLNYKQTPLAHTFIKVGRQHAAVTIFKRILKSTFVPVCTFIKLMYAPPHSEKKRRSLMQAFVRTSHFSYGPLTLIFYSRSIEHSFHRICERAQQLV